MTTIAIRQPGRMANRVLQHLTAHRLAQEIGGAQITGSSLPDWDLQCDPNPRGHRCWPKLDVQRYDVPWLTQQMAEGAFERVTMSHVASDIDLLPSREEASEIIDAKGAAYYATTPDEIVIHVRLEDTIVPGTHKGYGPLPLAYYRRIVDETGLEPVFVGQFGDDPYSDALRREFPGAVTLEGGSVLHDFETIRNAYNVIIGVSTFSWVAAWLGVRERVFYPMLGIFNPLQTPNINLTPADDPRYRFELFPRRRWSGSEDAVAELITGPAIGKRIEGRRVQGVLDAAREDYAPRIEAWKARMLQTEKDLAATDAAAELSLRRAAAGLTPYWDDDDFVLECAWSDAEDTKTSSAA